MMARANEVQLRGRILSMRRMLAAFAAFAALLAVSGARADVPSVPVAAQNRSTEPVVLTGASFPSWSAGPEVGAHEPQVPTNYDTADVQQYLQSVGLASACYRKPSDDPNTGHPDPYDYSDTGDHNCYQPNRVPQSQRGGADTNRILGYVWDAASSQFVQIPFQVDQVFTRYITNNVSGFAF